jgi:hypothetical protein
MRFLYLAEQSDPINPDDPTLLNYQVIVTTLEQQAVRPPDDELNALLRYLESKGYVQVQWLNDGTGGWSAVRILSLGTDLVEGSIEDAGVKFSKRR